MTTPTVPDLVGRLTVAAVIHGDFVLTDGPRLMSYVDEHRLAADPHLPSEADMPSPKAGEQA